MKHGREGGRLGAVLDQVRATIAPQVSRADQVQVTVYKDGGIIAETRTLLTPRQRKGEKRQEPMDGK